MKLNINDRVFFHKAIELYNSFTHKPVTLPVHITGIVTYVTENYVKVRLDKQIDFLAEHDNELAFDQKELGGTASDYVTVCAPAKRGA